MQLHQTIVRFPEISLQTRDAHKLRGYFGNIFKEHSPLLHNHYGDGRNRYAYPLVQYKVLHSIPVLTGLAAGAQLLIDLFLKIKNLEIDGKLIEVTSKNIESKILEMHDNGHLSEYRFDTLWMGLNEVNFRKYIDLHPEEKDRLLASTLIGNILSFYKGIGFWTKQDIMVKHKLTEKNTLFKNRKMIAFAGSFISNAFLPDHVGLGKAVSRGFGSVLKV
ncbi:MAG: hypothetical protein JXA03_14780 [Bacteroidales bacterium]|nr:hypothetical protein [Bacteroidales bacterium]